MKAKDTVRYLPNEYRECADEDGVIQKYKVPIHEPSFKAGEQLSLGKQGQAYLEGKQAGVKEVVDWLDKLCPCHNRPFLQDKHY